MRMLRSLVVLASGILLLHALIYGPGRGLTLIPADDQHYGLVRLMAYGLIFAGAMLTAKMPRIAALTLYAGLLARAELELHYYFGSMIAPKLR